MQEKIIKKNLNKLVDSWFSSITDKNLVELLKRDIIITGGSIVNMVLNEEVNDYDIYLRDKETVNVVANYYVNLFNKKNNGKVASVETENGRYIIKLFDTTNKKEKKINKSKKYDVLFLTDNAITLKDGIQIIIRFFGEPEDIHKNYDFVHCTGYWTYYNNELHISKEVYECIINKTLKYQGSLYPVSSIFRLRKFLKRGWTINVGQIFKIIYQISKLDLDNICVLKDQLVGVDILYFLDMLSYLKKNLKEEEPVSMEIISRAIKEVFEE
ncbi:MAG: hypothetical protein ACOC3V_00020 [bacterium]